VEKYLFYIKDNLRMLLDYTTATTKDNGLISYMFRHLKKCSSTFFQDFIRTQHVEFQEGKQPDLMLTKFIANMEDKIRVLKHAV